MKLHIENFARISSADIEFDGLTVIAGKNNMGKSTVGKVLYTFFRALSQMPRRVRRDRIDAVRRAVERNVDRSITEEQAQQLLEGSASVDDVYRQLKESDKADALQSFFAPSQKVGCRNFQEAISTKQSQMSRRWMTELSRGNWRIRFLIACSIGRPSPCGRLMAMPCCSCAFTAS